MGFLKLIGAVSAAEHSKVAKKRDEALKDLATEVEDREAAQADRDRLKDKLGAEIRTSTRLALDLSTERKTITALHEEIAALRPDAEKHRAKLARDRGRVRPSRAKAPTKGAK